MATSPNPTVPASTGATSTSLNPDAPAFFPVAVLPATTKTSDATDDDTNLAMINFQQLILSPSLLPPVPAAFHPQPPPPVIHVPHEFLLPLNHHHLTILQHQHLACYLPSILPPPQPPLSPPPPTVEMMSLSVDHPVLVRSEAEAPADEATSFVIFKKSNDGPPNRQMVKTFRRKKGFGFRLGFKFGRRVTGRSEPVHEDKEREDGNLVKYQSVELKREEDKTTVMIKNIPNQYTPAVLVDFMDKYCMSENRIIKQLRNGDDEQNKPISAYDFLYLPMDFKTNLNKGYAFVNFTEPEAAWKFFVAFDGKRWDIKRSSKTRKIVCARIQGKEALVAHFKKSTFDCESDEYLPFCFSPARDGSGNEVQRTVIGHRIGKSRFLSRF